MPPGMLVSLLQCPSHINNEIYLYHCFLATRKYLCTTSFNKCILTLYFPVSVGHCSLLPAPWNFGTLTLSIPVNMGHDSLLPEPSNFDRLTLSIPMNLGHNSLLPEPWNFDRLTLSILKPKINPFSSSRCGAQKSTGRALNFRRLTLSIPVDVVHRSLLPEPWNFRRLTLSIPVRVVHRSLLPGP